MAFIICPQWCIILLKSNPCVRAGLQYGVSNTTTGFRITVSGYSHKLLTLLNAVLERIVGFEVLDDRFEVQQMCHTVYRFMLTRGECPSNM